MTNETQNSERLEEASILNRAVWNPEGPNAAKPFKEEWYLKMNDPKARRSLWLRFTILNNPQGGRHLAETWAIFSSRNDRGQVFKTALKQSHPLSVFQTLSSSNDVGFRIGECEFWQKSTRGQIQADKQAIAWNFQITPNQNLCFNFVPTSLARLGIIKNQALTVGEDLHFSGSCEVDGKSLEWNKAPGMQGHLIGSKNGHSWAWGHCNSFVNEDGQPVSFVFDGLSARARIGKRLRTPQLSSFFFCYQGIPYRINGLCDTVRSQSQYSLNRWEFKAKHKDLLFHGIVKAKIQDFSGITYEDTDQSLLYCFNSKLSDMTMKIYRNDKLETTLIAPGSAAYEVVSQKRTPIFRSYYDE